MRTTTWAVAMPASWLRAPGPRLTAVWDRPPPAGKAWKKPPARLAVPRARSSWSASAEATAAAVRAARVEVVLTDRGREVPRRA